MLYAALIYAPVEEKPTMTRGASTVKCSPNTWRLHRGREAGRVWRAGEPLQPTSTATTIRIRQGNKVMTDGPFAETKEWLAGLYFLECASLDEALEWAAKCPGAKYGSMEVRPVMEIPARV